jgi:serine/threonine protein kinase
LTTTCGTANYMAPELTKNKNGEYDGTKVDIFAMGVILYIMVQGGFPFARAEDDYYKKLQKHPN